MPKVCRRSSKSGRRYSVAPDRMSIKRLIVPVNRPQIVALGGIAGLATLGWLWLGAMALPPSNGSDALAADLLRSICRVDAGAAASADFGAAGLVLAMWAAMALAMMLPTAAPMITTYAEIAETAREKRIAVVSPLVLTAGYLAAWLGFCVAAAALQVALGRAAWLASPWLGAAVLAIAGLYQFSAFKAACLAKCRSPMPYFFANWSDRAAGVFRMGAEQGMVCIACCWALMLVMFASGLMNLAWMAVLTVIMLLEKVLPRPAIVVKGTGVLCLAWACVIIAGAVR